MKRLATFCAGVIFTLAAVAGLGACSTTSVTEYQGMEPELKLEEDFVGQHKAHGFFRDRFGKVRRSFVVDIEGRWEPADNRLTLREDFVYEDDSTETRIWVLTKTGENTWEGSADGVVGTATGETSGNAFNWRYTFDLPQGDGKTLRVKFDDWMYLMPDNILLNTATISKFGVELGEVVISFQPVPTTEAQTEYPAAAE
ncbi:MAG: DUF3833 domain-containing protein [Alphaproteobacteria bacterium]